ncbi:hypothetical protein [Clostridium cylindrosporum]|uniref:hypothetical protein n=1 Tax=Clostridium cylindrosporum TaxID=1495 RepID=UPI000B262BD7|nr:hypothetical protein [Clostridium cylindrosporum]
MIAPITFIVSVFSPNVSIYETNNNGLSYEFGFIIGVSSSLGKGSSIAHDSVNIAP